MTTTGLRMQQILDRIQYDLENCRLNAAGINLAVFVKEQLEKLIEDEAKTEQSEEQL